MYDVEVPPRTVITEDGDTLDIRGNDTIVKQKIIVDQKEPEQMRVMYGTPYSRFSNEEKAIAPDKSE